MDKSTGKELMVNEKPVTAEKTFTPEKADGSVELAFTFDGSNLAGKTVVVFESLFVEDTEVAVHADIQDKGQSVEYPEHKIQTQAKDKESGTQEAQTKANTTILDTVSYEGLIPGQSYTLKGVLMDKATGEPLLINNKQITAEKIFIPEKSSGTAEMEFTFDATFAAGKEIVVFEHLYVQGTEVAAHTDINDKNQTVTVKVNTPAVPKKNDTTITPQVKTGDTTPVAGIVVALLLSGAVIAVVIVKRRKGQKSK